MANSSFPSVGAVMANAAAQAARPAFELQFNQLQNTVIRRLNDEIEKVNTTSPLERHKVEGLKKEGVKLANALPVLEQYKVGNQHNLSRMEKLREMIASLMETFHLDAEVDEQDVATIETKKQEIAAEINNLYVLTHPDITDGDITRRIKDEKANLESQSAVVGSPEDNQAFMDYLTALDSKLDTAQEVTSNTVYLVVDMQASIQSDMSEIEAEMTEINTLQQLEKSEKIQDMREKYGQILQAISLSFESSNDYVTMLNEYLSPRLPPAGSVLNMFS